MVTRLKADQILELNQLSFDQNEISKEMFQKKQAELQTHVSF
jgi:hypothetical protein